MALALSHRIFHPSFPSPPFLDRHAPHPAQHDDPQHIHPDLRSDLLYQVALPHPHKSQALWDFSSVKACHLDSATAQTIVLHLAPDDQPYALDYLLSPYPSDGLCPPTDQRPNLSPNAAFLRYHQIVSSLNTTVVFVKAQTAPLPELTAPPSVTPEGNPATPVPEKTFIQKYWMYIGAFLLFLLVGGGGEESGEQKRSQ